MYKFIGVFIIMAVLVSVFLGGFLFVSYKKVTDTVDVPPSVRTIPDVPLRGDVIYGDPRNAIMPCTQEAKVCSDGSTVSRHGPDCRFDDCPAKKDQKHAKDATDATVLCPDIYAPVCAQPPMPPCPPGMNCVQVLPAVKTFSSACHARAVGAEVIADDVCPSQQRPTTHERTRVFMQ